MFTHFPLTVWLATIAGLIAIVAIDLVVIARRKRTVTFRDALMWVAAYVSLAALFAVALLLFGPGPSGSQFIAGYITEYTLSVDNLFVFVIIMSRFAVPAIAQDRALYIGILGSLLLRAIFILAGAGVLALANWVFYPLGALLLYTAVRLMI
ncbi:MAG TPA: TerC family protein, partial [Micromonosporaceae bacterium]